MTSPSHGRRQTGAAAVGERRKRPLLPLLLGLLALLVAAGLLIYFLTRDSGSKKTTTPLPVTSSTAAPATSSQATASPSTVATAPSTAASTPASSTPAASTAPASTPAASGGILQSDTGTSLLGIAASNGAAAQVGHNVTGTGAVVQAPMDLKDGFWVGDSPTDSYFVDLADSLTTTPTGPVVPLSQGQAVNFTGQLVANTPDYIAEATSDGIPNIAQLTAEGYHIATTPGQVHGA